LKNSKNYLLHKKMEIFPGETRENETSEAEAEGELLKSGIQAIPENVRTVIELQKTKQHPDNYQEILATDDLEKISKAMRDREIKQVIHAEDPSLWIHCKLAMKLAEFLPISEEKKADLKLIMLYHDLGKTKTGLSERSEIQAIQKKELGRGKLYKVAKGHATERPMDIKVRLKANGITGKKLEMFMAVVQNHMETQLADLPGKRLAKIFEGFGETDGERKEAAEMLAWVVQVDGNATMHLQFDEQGELAQLKKENTTGKDFDKIWERYLEAEGKQ